ncbi:Rho termination factor N-terminal domain-containing protein, partial [Eubacteriales bacterium OttesenSCG-928-M02]|nr:Rho termination factor N-terminal domain-containing protein [Eubacteriales bacterium OttesenSCG-928-M02]
MLSYDYESRSLMELRETAKDLGLKSVTRYKKADLIAAILLEEAKRAAQQEGRLDTAAQPLTNGASPEGEAMAVPVETVEKAGGGRRTAGTRGRVRKDMENGRAEAQTLAEGGDGAPMENGRSQGRPHSEVRDSVKEILDSGECGEASGVLEILPDGYGFLRSENYMPGTSDVYVSIAQIRRFGLKTGDLVKGKTRPGKDNDKHMAIIYIDEINGLHPSQAMRRKPFEDLIPIYPDMRLTMEREDAKRDLSL